jgi:hypothetical protein
VIFCLDSSKFGRRSVAHLCDLSVIDTIVTDAAAPGELVAKLRERGIEVVIAPVSVQPTPAPPAAPPSPPAMRKPRLRRTSPSPAPAPAPTPAKPPAISESSDNRMGWD